MPTRHNMIDRGGISRPAASLPLACGIGLKPQHASQLVQQPADIGFVEIHARSGSIMHCRCMASACRLAGLTRQTGNTSSL